MQFAVAVSQAETLPELSEALVAGISGALEAAPDLAVLFLNASLLEQGMDLAHALRSALRPRVLLAASCEGVLGGDREIERQPGAVLLAASMPGVSLRPFAISPPEWSQLLAGGDSLRGRVVAGEEHQGQLLLADPFSTPVDDLLGRLDEATGRPTFGGMASAAQAPGGNLLLLDDRVLDSGAVGVGFAGPVRVETVVSQGCRPIAEPLVVTRAEQNLILELGRRPALDVVEELLPTIPAADLELLRRTGLFVGIVINEYQASFHRGDFLVRGFMGADRERRALAVGDLVRAGQTVQFHVRDAATAHEDLTELLAPQQEKERPAGGFLFSCNGRGRRMFSQPHHDIRTTLEAMPGTPLAGFFAMGELGPVGGKSFIHGHTASLALFRPA